MKIAFPRIEIMQNKFCRFTYLGPKLHKQIGKNAGCKFKWGM